jgi:hypothetical protein
MSRCRPFRCMARRMDPNSRAPQSLITYSFHITKRSFATGRRRSRAAVRRGVIRNIDRTSNRIESTLNGGTLVILWANRPAAQLRTIRTEDNKPAPLARHALSPARPHRRHCRTAIDEPAHGLAAHVEGLMNGTFLVAWCALCREIKFPRESTPWRTGVQLYGTYRNWVMTGFAAMFGTAAIPAKQRAASLGGSAS